MPGSMHWCKAATPLQDPQALTTVKQAARGVVYTASSSVQPQGSLHRLCLKQLQVSALHHITHHNVSLVLQSSYFRLGGDDSSQALVAAGWGAAQGVGLHIVTGMGGAISIGQGLQGTTDLRISSKPATDTGHMGPQVSMWCNTARVAPCRLDTLPCRLCLLLALRAAEVHKPMCAEALLRV